jgi:hypothetical protein
MHLVSNCCVPPPASPVAQVPVYKLPVVSGHVASVLLVTVHCDAGVRVTEEALVELVVGPDMIIFSLSSSGCKY